MVRTHRTWRGQGAVLSRAARRYAFLLHDCTGLGLVPLVVIATAAAVIASQALISGSFSATRQAIQLGLARRLDVEHTPAYGWDRSTCDARCCAGDLYFNDHMADGATPRRASDRARVPLEHFMRVVTTSPPLRVPGTAVFMTAQPQGTPPALAHNLRHNKILHEHVVVLTGDDRSDPASGAGPAVDPGNTWRWCPITSACSTRLWRLRTFLPYFETTHPRHRTRC